MTNDFCPGCGQRCRTGDRFCRGCGEPLTDDARAIDPITQAEALAVRGHLDEAIATVQRAIGEDPRADLEVALATLYLRRGDGNLAERALDRAIDIQPDYAVAYAYKAGVRLQRGEVDDAQELLDRAAAMAPRDLLVRIKRAEFWLRLGVFSNARDELRQGLANGGGSPGARTLADAMLADIEKQMQGTVTRNLVPLPSLEPIRRLLSRKARRTGVEVEP